MFEIIVASARMEWSCPVPILMGSSSFSNGVFNSSKAGVGDIVGMDKFAVRSVPLPHSSMDGAFCFFASWKR